MMNAETKDMNKRREAMKKRLKGLGSGNPVVEKAIKKQEPMDAYEDFEIVHELVSAAMAKYSDEGGSLSECLSDLGKAISKAASKVDKKSAEDDY